MPKPRKSLISLQDTTYYHCVSRCVRRAFLCGQDELTGQSYEHRRGWIEDKMLSLAAIFAIDICAYSVMSNHTHLVLHVNENEALNWDVKQVLERWHRLHKGTQFTQKYLENITLEEFELASVYESCEKYRKRLCDISWFMKELNEPIARMANNEDKCTGHFWEGRFKSQALLDESALVACMAYIDLNPVRAKIEKTPENSKHTSIKTRIEVAKANQTQPKTLFPFIGYEREDQPEGLPFKHTDYLELIDLTGRVLREDKRGNIDMSLAPILQRINLTSEQWLEVSTEFEKHFKSAVGSELLLAEYCEHTELQRRTGLAACKRLLT
ncbi:transposase [Marinomonas sp. SBI22]|uniref:transposase n=1 Tax=unclassified Marinomonas TaxID=196814 RepID=UPI0007AFC81E|nr:MULTISPECIES: transposase [unclassified Marinomonas]KZM39601.1 transposase [Marinomonas sp. SBI22]KZM41830.1 transposase [Marinomonas sp. SBI8L]